MLYSRKCKRLYIGEKFAPWILAIGKIHSKKGTLKKKSSSLNSVKAPDLQSKIRISKNSLRHDSDLKKSAPLTSLMNTSVGSCTRQFDYIYACLIVQMLVWLHKYQFNGANASLITYTSVWLRTSKFYYTQVSLIAYKSIWLHTRQINYIHVSLIRYTLI